MIGKQRSNFTGVNMRLLYTISRNWEAGGRRQAAGRVRTRAGWRDRESAYNGLPD